MFTTTSPKKQIPSSSALAAALTIIFVSSANAAVTFTETTDAGNSIATSVEVGTGFDTIKGFQFASGPDLRDFFKLTFSTDVSFTAHDLIWPITNPTNASLHLFDASSTQLSSCFNCFFTDANQGTEVLSADLSAGVYYIEVRNTLGTEASKELGEYQFSFTAIPVPEPSSFMLLGLAGLGMVASRRRRCTYSQL